MPTELVQPTLIAATGWSNTGNLPTINGSAASITLINGAEATATFNLQHTLPAGSTVLGVRVRIDVASSAGTDILWTVGVASLAESQVTIDTFLTDVVFGSLSNANGVTRTNLASGLTVTVDALEFTEFNTTDALLDGIEVQIEYVQPVNSPSIPEALATILLDD